MPRCSETALEAALRELGQHADSNIYRANWLSTYLTAKRADTAGYGLTIAGVNRAVDDLFVLVPGHPNGRSNPFLNLESRKRWLKVADSGRSTVWNNGTRNNEQTVLFRPSASNAGRGHFSEGLLPNAAQIAVEHLENDETEDPLAGRDALAVFVTRDHVWLAEPSPDELHTQAQRYLGISAADFNTITEDTTLGTPIVSDPEWSADLLSATDLGPPPIDEPAVAGTQETAEPEIAVEDVKQLPEQFRRFLNRFGIALESDEELIDILATTLSSQLVIMAGPSGSGKSLTASALASFFAPAERRCRLESSRLLAKREEFLGYYSHLAGETFQVLEPLQLLLDATNGAASTPPMITIEEANLSPIEGYLSPLVHGLGSLEVETLTIGLHDQPAEVPSQVSGQAVPRHLELTPYPRFFATINVDADSPAPARKVVSRACVVLLETPRFETVMAAADTLTHPSVEEGTGPASRLIGKPTIAFDRYSVTGSDVFQQALKARADLLRGALGADVIAHRALQRSLLYMAWHLELTGRDALEEGLPEVQAAADNALLHFVLPTLPASQFERAIEALDDDARAGVLAKRIERLRQVAEQQQFGPPPDFWGALS